MTDAHLPRRRFLGIAGLASAAALTQCSRPPRKAAIPPAWQWRGILFGAEASIALYGVNAERGEHLTRLCFDKMRHLESLFSLYRPDSAVCRLNREGFLEQPPAEFRDLVERSLQFSRHTGGAFDITVQPLWELYHRHFREGDRSSPPSEEAIAAALRKVNYEALLLSEERIDFSRDEMAVTFNGIAQGYITDRVTDFIRGEGMDRTLVHMGEYRALGTHPENRPWNIGIRLPGSAEEIIDELSLEDGALAVSGGYGYTFDPLHHHHHLFHPRTAAHLPADRTVCVTAPRATDADAYSTACAVVDEQTAQSWLPGTDAQLRIYGPSA